MSWRSKKRTIEDAFKEGESTCTDVCIIHFKDSYCQNFTLLSNLPNPDDRFAKLKQICADRRLEPLDSPHRMDDMCDKLPDTWDRFHGYHRDCYQKFTKNLDHLQSNKASSSGTQATSLSRESRSSSSKANEQRDKVLFHPDCIFCCRKGLKAVKKGSTWTTEGLSTFERGGGPWILEIAEQKGDEKLLRRIRGFDLFSCEAQFHPSCRTAYVQVPVKWRSKDEAAVSEEQKLSEAHAKAFDEVCHVVSKQVVKEKGVIKLTYLTQTYKGVLEKTPYANPHYRGENLKSKLEKCELFAGVIAFCPIGGDKRLCRSYFVYSLKISVADAINASYSLGCSDTVKEVAGLLRDDVMKAFDSSSDLPWPPVVDFLQEKPVLPEKLELFLRTLISKKHQDSCRVDRLVSSLGQDLCRAVTNGKWKLPKHIILGMSLRHLFRSAELINLMNRLGHCENYSFLLEIETAVAMAVESASSLLAVSIVRNPTCPSVFHSDFDNYDEYISDIAGAGSVHRSHGIMLQDLVVKEGEEVGGFIPVIPQGERTGRRSLGGTADSLPECLMGKRKSPSYVIDKITPEDGPKELESACMRNLLWLLIRFHEAKTNQGDTIPAWVGYVSLTGSRPSRLTTVEYYPIISKPITEMDAVQECLRYSEEGTNEVGQKYVITSFDLGVCMKAYPLIWGAEERYRNHIIMIGTFHLTCAYLKMVGKKMEGTGLTDVFLEAGLISPGSLTGVIKGTNYARAMNCHKTVLEAIERLLLSQFLESRNEEKLFQSLPAKSRRNLQALQLGVSKEAEALALEDEMLTSYLTDYLSFKDGVRNGSLGKTAKLWLSFGDHIWLVLHLQRAVKMNNFALYTQVLCLMPDLFFSFGGFNYARYVTFFSTFLVNIETSHPEATDLLKRGAFSVARSFIPGNRAAVDKTIEETFMRHSKSRGGGGSGAGLTGMQADYSAYQRWCRSTKERAKYLQAAYEMADMVEGDTGSSHRENRPAEKRRGERLVSETVATFENFVNPFDMSDKESLVCVSSGVPASLEIENDVLRAEQAGAKAKLDFIEERLKKGTGFFDPIKQLKLKTMGGMKKSVKLKTSQQKEVQYSQQGSIAYQLLVKSQQDNSGDHVNLAELMSYQLTPVPYSLALVDGSLNKTDKSKGMHHLLHNQEEATPFHSSDTLVIEDGNAVFHKLKDILGTFAEIAVKILEDSVLKTTSPVIFSTDMYASKSVKAMERKRRGVADKFIIKSGKMKRPKDWKEFLSNDDNKTQLVKVLLKTWGSSITAKMLQGRNVTLISEGRAYNLKSDGNAVKVEELPTLMSTQEETDTRVILYAMHAKQQGFRTVRVKSPDTDIFFILLHHAHRLEGLQILFETGKGRTKRCINISQLAESLTPKLCSALLALHAYTGCDSTSSFKSKGKVKPLKILLKHEPYQDAFAELGESVTIATEVQTMIEGFTCEMYGDKRLKKVNELRHSRLLSKCGQDGKISSSRKINFASLPPCQSTMVEHMKRANYQVRVWKYAHIAQPDIPDPTDGHGWVVEDGNLAPKWSSKDVLPVKLVDILDSIDQDETESDSEEEGGVESDYDEESGVDEESDSDSDF